MSLKLTQDPNLTPRERQELDWEKEATHLQADLHKRQQDYELEIRKLEVKWTQLFRIPTALILLPVKLILALAIPIAAISKQTLPKEYWEFLKG